MVLLNFSHLKDSCLVQVRHRGLLRGQTASRRHSSTLFKTGGIMYRSIFVN